MIQSMQETINHKSRCDPQFLLCECTAATSITIGTGVTIKNGAAVTFKSPIVKLQSGFHAENGAVVNIKQNVNTPIASSVDIASFQAGRNGTWFSVDLSTLPETQISDYLYFSIKESVVDNRKNGQISPTLLSGYFFTQWDISSSALEQYNHTIRALFLRSALMRFIDYPNNRVLGWNDKSINIPTDIRGIIRQCNEKNL